jgi:hypothetical protein
MSIFARNPRSPSTDLHNREEPAVLDAQAQCRAPDIDGE